MAPDVHYVLYILMKERGTMLMSSLMFLFFFVISFKELFQMGHESFSNYYKIPCVFFFFFNPKYRLMFRIAEGKKQSPS